MFNKFDTLVNHSGGITTEIKLLSRLDKQGKATVKLLRAGYIDAPDGFVLRGFNVLNGLIKFSKS